ncbi:MAG: hypothetical protein AAF170_13110 [Bacteroidota bacterium]
MPWEDLVQFRDDAESRSYLRKIRLWLQERAQVGTLGPIVSEELDDLLSDYRRYMKIQHKKYGNGIVSALILSSGDALANIMNMRPGSALRALIDVRRRKIALDEAELSAPGREIAYLAKAQDAFGTGMR